MVLATNLLTIITIVIFLAQRQPTGINKSLFLSTLPILYYISQIESVSLFVIRIFRFQYNVKISGKTLILKVGQMVLIPRK